MTDTNRPEVWFRRLHLGPVWRLEVAPLRGFLGAQWWQALPAGQGRTSSLRCGRSTLTCGSSPARPAPAEESRNCRTTCCLPEGGARSGRHRGCPVQGGAAAGRHGGANSRRPNQKCCTRGRRPRSAASTSATPAADTGTAPTWPATCSPRCPRDARAAAGSWRRPGPDGSAFRVAARVAPDPPVPPCRQRDDEPAAAHPSCQWPAREGLAAGHAGFPRAAQNQ
jgi:hypothetical protein